MRIGVSPRGEVVTSGRRGAFGVADVVDVGGRMLGFVSHADEQVEPAETDRDGEKLGEAYVLGAGGDVEPSGRAGLRGCASCSIRSRILLSRIHRLRAALVGHLTGRGDCFAVAIVFVTSE